jgi:ankyrin repeat protein
MKKATLLKPTLTLIASALLLLAGQSIASTNRPDTIITTITSSDNQTRQHEAELLINAATNNRFGVIEQLVNRGININTPVIGDGTVLMVAVKHNNLTMVEDLIDLGADVNQPSQGDGNPLIVASKHGHLNMVKHLLQQHANINTIVPGDETALINASRSGHLAIVQWLVEQGADVNLAVTAKTLFETETRSPLNQAANDSIKQYLRSQGATQ